MFIYVMTYIRFNILLDFFSLVFSGGTRIFWIITYIFYVYINLEFLVFMILNSFKYFCCDNFSH